MTMNMDRHREAHRRLYRHLAQGETEEARKIKDFYDEYFAVLDLTEEFYIETIDRIFQQAELATGNFTYRGRPVDPGAIRNTALLTVEGGRDDICALGQTAVAHELCTALRPHLQAPPPAGQRRPLRRLQRPALGERGLSGGAQHDPRDGVAGGAGRGNSRLVVAAPGVRTGQAYQGAVVTQGQGSRRIAAYAMAAA